MAGRLEGKVCVVTGASGGIGAATVAAFQREGAKVVGVDLHDDAPGDLALAVDVTDEAATEDTAPHEFDYGDGDAGPADEPDDDPDADVRTDQPAPVRESPRGAEHRPRTAPGPAIAAGSAGSIPIGPDTTRAASARSCAPGASPAGTSKVLSVP